MSYRATHHRQRPLRSVLATSITLALGWGAASSYAQESTTTGSDQDSSDVMTLAPIIVDFRAEGMSSPKYMRELRDTPRIITVLPEDLLKQQNATSVRDAMRNVTGISLQAGEGNPPAGDQLKIRGFNARDDINVNGVRDLGNYFRDPFYVEQIEVVKGPNSTFGGRGSAGGTINFVSKKAETEAANQLELSLGTDNLYRATADLNQPLSDNSAFRVNLMNHDADMAGRDIANESRYGFHGAYTWGFTGDTRVNFDYLHTRQDNLPDNGLPNDRETRNDRGAATGRLPAGIDFSNFYGHLDDYEDIAVDQVGVEIEHLFGNGVVLRNQTRYSRVHNDSLRSSPRIRTRQSRDSDNPGRGSLIGAFGIGDIKPRDQTDRAVVNQTDFITSFDTGAVKHDVIAGFEFAQNSFENRRRPDVSGDANRVDLFDPDYSNRTRPMVPYDGTVHRFETDEFAAYFIDTVELSPQWTVNAGLRYDRVDASASDRGHPGAPVDLDREDDEMSYNLGVVYKPDSRTSIYAALGTAFQISGGYDRNVVQLAGNSTARVASSDTFDIAPEETTAYEIGAKWELFDDLLLSTAIFRTDKNNARTPAIGQGDVLEVLDGRQRVQGFELIAAGNITPRWRVYSGYTYLDSEVLRSNNPFEVGQSLGGTPKNTFNLFSTFDVTPRFTFGGGLQYISSQTGTIAPRSVADTIAREGRLVVSIPSYTVMDAFASYRFSENTLLRFNVTNITDKDYISQLAEGGAQGVPGAGRRFMATVRYDFD